MKTKNITMIGLDEKRHHYSRLEDFIRIAKEGKRVDMEVDLKKLPVIHEGNLEGKIAIHQKNKSYLLIAYFTFKTGGQFYRLSKVYMFATGGESLDSLVVNKEIADTRLQVDYDRLKAAHIHFKENYF